MTVPSVEAQDSSNNPPSRQGRGPPKRRTKRKGRKNTSKSMRNADPSDSYDLSYRQEEEDSEEAKVEEGREGEETEERTEEAAEEAEDKGTNLTDLPNDAYTFIFLSPWGSQGFIFGLVVFSLKFCLYSLLWLDAYATIRDTKSSDTPNMVLAAQCIILPVAVAMQSDLRTSFTILSNVKYSDVVLEFHPSATQFKYYFSNFLRGWDGAYSLCINFTVLLMADSAQALFLNFAALEFLQTIDDMAYGLAKEGFLTPRLEEMACKVEEMQLPKRTNPMWTKLDSILFISTFESFLASWFVLKIYY